MGKQDGTARGFVGLFGPRTKATIWISGFVTATEFLEAQARLERLYAHVYGRKPKRVTKTDVVEYLLMGGTAAKERLEGLRARGVARSVPKSAARRGNGDRR